MDAADPNVSQRAARERADSGGFMEAKSQYGMVEQALSPAFFLCRVHRDLRHGAVAHALVKLVTGGSGLQDAALDAVLAAGIV